MHEMTAFEKETRHGALTNEPDEHRSGDHGVSAVGGFDPIRKSRALLRGWRADFETPASIRITQVGRSPIESEEQRFSFEKIAPAHAVLYALRRRRTAPLDVSDASLVVGVGAFRACQHHVVSVADGIEDVHAADARLAYDVHGPVG